MGCFIGVLDPVWKSMLGECLHDFYHLPEYVSIEADQLQGEGMAYYHQQGKSKMLIPLIRCRILTEDNKDIGLHDAASPYGYPGVLFNKNFDTGLTDDFIMRFQQDAKELQLVTTIIRLNPLRNNILFQETEQINQVIRGYTIWIDLRNSQDALYASFSKNHRQDIKKLQANQFRVAVGNWKLYEQFVEMYYETMDRNVASGYYYFNQHYFLMLRAVLEKNIEFFAVKDPQGSICAGGLFTNYNNIVQSHLVATKNEYLHLSPAKLVFHEAIKWGKRKKCRWMNLGGGRGKEDEGSLLQFKQGFSKLKRRFSTLQIVHDLVKYQNILQQYEVLSADGNFFPLYRDKLIAKKVLKPEDAVALLSGHSYRKEAINGKCFSKKEGI